MSRNAQLQFHKEEFSFSAGHFTIFSATEREQLHGHNYYVSARFDFTVAENGLTFDYRHYKKILTALCKQLNTHFLLPTQSPYLTLEDAGDYWFAYFNQKKLPFLKEDVILLPLRNITIEELSYWFLQKILENKTEIAQHMIHGLTIQVYNGLGQSASAHFEQG